MWTRYQAAGFGLLATVAMCFDAAGESIETARAARERAKADLIRSQEAFDRADEAYINALRGVAPQPALTAPMAAPSPTSALTAASTSTSAPAPSLVTFSLSGPGSLEVNPLEYRARLIVDELLGAWTQHASGAQITAPAGARSVAYEVQNNATSDPVHTAWKTICQGMLPPGAAVTVDIAIAQKVTCNVR